jgi:hypothetical protein
MKLGEGNFYFREFQTFATLAPQSFKNCRSLLDKSRAEQARLLGWKCV